MIRKKDTLGGKLVEKRRATIARLKSDAASQKMKDSSTEKTSSPEEDLQTRVRKTTIRRSPLKKASVAHVSLDDLGPLPHSYGSDSIFLVAQDPHWLFTYWDIDISRHPGGPCFLRVERDAGALEQEIEVPFETRNWYIPVTKAGARYVVEIGFYRGNKWNIIARSGDVFTPRDRVSESSNFDFATIPLHISFQRLVETVQQTFESPQNLVPALAKAQKSVTAPSIDSKYIIPEREKVILGSLLGSEFLANLSSAGLSSEQLHSAIHQRLNERLHSGELSEVIARLQLSQAESSLFSAFAQWGARISSGSWNLSSAGFSERLTVGLSSWIAATLTSWTTAAETSWAAGAQGSMGSVSSETMTSRQVTGGSSEMFSSLSSWAGGSEDIAAMNSSSGNLSSWLESVNSSWSGVNMSSWAQAALSSWTEASASSWNLAASSWGSSEAPSSFSNHVTEDIESQITLRGRTHPQARVTIGGKVVNLDADGIFECKVSINDVRRGISMEAIAPDGSRLEPTF